jgi:hypothetical protein
VGGVLTCLDDLSRGPARVTLRCERVVGGLNVHALLAMSLQLLTGQRRQEAARYVHALLDACEELASRGDTAVEARCFRHKLELTLADVHLQCPFAASLPLHECAPEFRSRAKVVNRVGSELRVCGGGKARREVGSNSTTKSNRF